MTSEENYERWLASPCVGEDDKKALRAMGKAERADAFFKDIEFGTAGMRGIMGPGTNRMNAFTVKKATVAFGMYLLKSFKHAKARGVVISHDNRHLSREFTLQSAAILNQMGIKAYIFDSLRPTPELSYAVRYTKACGGIMVTASHNPKQDNGYKVYDETGCQLVPSQIQPLLDIIASLPDELSVAVKPSEEKGQTTTLGIDVDDTYVKLVEGIQLNPSLDKGGFQVVYSPQHGAGYEDAMRVFKDTGYHIIPVAIQCTHDPDFSGTLSPNPENADAYIEAIKVASAAKADLIVMTDPDGDRCGLAYRTKEGAYERLTGNQSAAMLIDYILSQRAAKGILHKDGVIYDTIVTSSFGREVAASYGIKTESFLTGFKYIGERIHHYEKLGHGPFYEFGYEESYGCLIAPFVRDKDGIQAILLYSEMALYHHLQGKTLGDVYEELQKRFGYHYDTGNSVYFKGEQGADEMKKIMDGLHKRPLASVGGVKVVESQDYLTGIDAFADGTKKKLALPSSEVIKLILEDKTNVCIRPSGTEPKVKFYIGIVAKDGADLAKKAADFYVSLKKELGIAD